MTIRIEERISEFTYQCMMVFELAQIGLITNGEGKEKKHPENRFDIIIYKEKGSFDAIGIIEMKRHEDGDMKKHESDFWKSDQGKRYKEVGRRGNIPVMYCAGPSEIKRVAKEMKRALMPWYLRWLV